VHHDYDFHTADMTAPPFADESYDVVPSGVAVLDVKGRAGRDRAIGEPVRVLRAGARVVLADIFATSRYRDRVAELGMTGVTRRGPGWRMWWSGPWLTTRLVTATKPPDRSAPGRARQIMVAHSAVSRSHH
jgi:hypothetical protein